jgi:hypothetical protein
MLSIFPSGKSTQNPSWLRSLIHIYRNRLFMKTHLLYILILATVSITGCSYLPKIFGKSSAAITSQQNKIQSTNQKLADNDKAKLEDIAVIATGTDHALSIVTNPPKAVVVARELNHRVIAEAGYQPTVEQLTAMYKMVDDLIADNTAGKKALAAKDMEIQELRNNEIELNKQKDQEVSKYMTIAQAAATKADTTQNELDKYQSYWGLGGVMIGIKSFATHVMWWGLGFMVVFMLLRVLSTVNPICGAIFGIFESIVGSFLHVIMAIIPKAFNTIQTVEQSTLEKVVDAIQFAKATATPDITTIQSQLASMLTDAEKSKITQIKTDLNYINK